MASRGVAQETDESWIPDNGPFLAAPRANPMNANGPAPGEGPGRERVTRDAGAD